MLGQKHIIGAGLEGSVSLPPLRPKTRCFPQAKTPLDYYPFGMLLQSYANASYAYSYGMNSQEKDNEIYGEGNAYTAEYWQYDSRLGRRWNVDPVVKAMTSPFASFTNNPIIFIDPNGDTEFYNSKGKWVGSDGKNNNLIAVTTNWRVRRKIRRNSRKGRYSDFGELKNGDTKGGLFVVNKKVLQAADEILDLAYEEDKKNKNSKREFGKVLIKKDNDFISSDIFIGEGGTIKLPKGNGSGVSIHSHPVGYRYDSRSGKIYASSPRELSPDDESSFKEYEMNVVVGNVGEIINEENIDAYRGSERVIGRETESKIVFYNSSAERIYEMDNETTSRILKTSKINEKRKSAFETKEQNNNN